MTQIIQLHPTTADEKLAAIYVKEIENLVDGHLETMAGLIMEMLKAIAGVDRFSEQDPYWEAICQLLRGYLFSKYGIEYYTQDVVTWVNATIMEDESNSASVDENASA